VVRPSQDCRRLPGLLGDVQQVLPSHPDAIENLRPAQDVCEQCHWPAKFWGEQLANRVHFSSDEKNTRREVGLLIKTGGGSVAGVNAGIHYHMNIQNKIWYAAADRRRQVIPWIQVQGPDGRVTEYLSTEKPFTAEELKRAEIRRMDCVDCHNRPSHRYLPRAARWILPFKKGEFRRSSPSSRRWPWRRW